MQVMYELSMGTVYFSSDAMDEVVIKRKKGGAARPTNFTFVLCAFFHSLGVQVEPATRYFLFPPVSYIIRQLLPIYARLT